jgi:hypothetical protein
MRTGAALLPAVLLAVPLSLLAGCGGADDEVGFGTLTVADLEGQPGHFEAAPRRVDTRLSVDRKGCLTVRVDGVDRQVIWPIGTEARDSAEQPGGYVVRIPGGPELTASGSTGSRFDAEGVIDTEGRLFVPDSKVGSMLAFCAVRAAPIAFRDASTFRRRGA